MFSLQFGQLETWIASFFWPFFRIASFFMIAPIFGSNLVNPRTKIALAFLITLAIYPTLDTLPKIDLLSLNAVLITIQQIIIGVSLGLFLQLLFALFVTAGQMIAMQMGLGFAAMVDPNNGISSTVISQFYLMLTTMLFIAFDGHLVVMEIFISSFSQMPIAISLLESDFLQMLLDALSWMFASALLIALPAICSVFLVNVSFGIITRASPQFNVFAIGFPFTMLIGLIAVWISLSGIVDNFEQLCRDLFSMLRQLIGLGEGE